MAPPLLTLQDIHLTFGGTPLLTGAEMFVHERDRICLVGRNGCGKSTFLKIAAGLVEHDTGERFMKPGITVRYLEQEPDFSKYKTTRAYAEAGLAGTDDPHRVTYLLEQLGLTGEEDPTKVSGGEARRAALARVMAPEPDILLLDEPTNHLDLPVIDWLESELDRTRSAIVLISHDRRFLQNLSKKTVWLDRGDTKELGKGFGHFEEWRDKVLEEEELEAHKLDRKIVAEEHWLRYGVTARRKRNVRRLGDLHALRKKRDERVGPQGGVKLAAATSDKSGKLVIEADDISKSYGARDIVKDFTIRINRGDRIGIAGPNGAGKTTLINLLTGALVPDAGAVRMGTSLEVIKLDQKRENLNMEDRLADALTGGTGGKSDVICVNGGTRHVMSYLKDFLFTPEQARTQLKALSGGERGRLALAIALANPSNLMILDEPTNDLDLETLDLLEEMLSDYQGTVILVSHDRDFLDRIVTSTIAPIGEGKWREYPGGYTDMMRQKKNEHKEKASSSSAPKERKSVKSTDAPNQKANKLSYKDKFALEQLPKEIEAVSTQIENYKKILEDANLFTKNPEKFNKTIKALEEAEASLAAKEEQWLDLEMKREELNL